MTAVVSEAGAYVCQECDDDPASACVECAAGGAWEPANAAEILQALLDGTDPPSPLYLGTGRRVRLRTG